MTGGALSRKANRQRARSSDDERAGRRRLLLLLGVAATLVVAAAVGGCLVLGGESGEGVVVVEGRLQPTDPDSRPVETDTGSLTAEVEIGQAQALAKAFELTPGQTVEPCATADVADTLCYIPFLMNLEDGRFLHLVGAPFSEVFAWALVEEQPKGTFTATETATYDYEGDGTPPFAVQGSLAGLVFTSGVENDLPVDRADEGNSPMPAGATELTVFVRYSGLGAFDSATVVVERDGLRVGEPSTIVVAPGGEGTGTVVLGAPGGEPLPAGAYTATVILKGQQIALARAVVQGE
jgi:hypothetical protein